MTPTTLETITELAVSTNSKQLRQIGIESMVVFRSEVVGIMPAELLDEAATNLVAAIVGSQDLRFLHSWTGTTTFVEEFGNEISEIMLKGEFITAIARSIDIELAEVVNWIESLDLSN